MATGRVYTEKIQKANSLVEQFVKGEPNFVMCDTWGIFADEKGNPNPEDFRPDHLHLNAAGYAVWKKAPVNRCWLIFIWSLAELNKVTFTFCPSYHRVAGFAAGDGTAGMEDDLSQKAQILQARVEGQFACGGQHRMAMEDDHSFPLAPGQFLEALAQVNFLRGKQVLVETADLLKRRPLAKNKRSAIHF